MLEYEVMWPLDREDYLTVCENHLTPYVTCAALLARDGDQENDDEPFNPPHLNDYQNVAASPLLLRWITLTELASEMGCSQKEIASLAHHLASAAKRGLIDRQQVPRTISGIKRLRWSYRRINLTPPASPPEPDK